MEEATRTAFKPFARVTLLDPRGLNSRDIEAAVESLSQLHGVGTRMSSAVLTFFRPDLFTILDWRAWGVLERHGLVPGEGSSRDLDRPSTYVEYLAVCTSPARERHVSLRNLGRFLVMLSDTGCDPASFIEHRVLEGLVAQVSGSGPGTGS